MGKADDYVGVVFGRLKVAEALPENDWKVYVIKGKRHVRPVVRAVCVCGARWEGQLASLTNGHTTSCGCAKRERTANMGRANIKHGLRTDPAYDNYKDMLRRCYDNRNPNYPRYGGRGIVVCDRWKESIANFIKDMGPKPGPGYSVERVNNDGPYCAENCVWLPKEQQARNKSNTIRVAYGGESLTLSQLVEKTKIAYRTLLRRYNVGDTGERLVRPVGSP